MYIVSCYWWWWRWWWYVITCQTDVSPIPFLFILVSDIFIPSTITFKKNYVKVDSFFLWCVSSKLKEEVYIRAKWLISPVLISRFYSMKWLGAFLLPPECDTQVHCRVTPSIKFAGTHLNTWAERGTVKVKCLAQYHKTMSLARTWAWTARSRGKCTTHASLRRRCLVTK